MTVRAQTERNFRRARVKPGRRTRLGARLSWAVVRRFLSVTLLVFGLYQAAAFVLTTPLLRVEKIAVRGNVRLSSGELQALVDDLRGTNILRADLDAFRRRLMGAPWVREVALRRVLPSTIEVFVSERRPMGLCRLGDELFLIDETGTVIDQFGPQYAEFDLPIVDGLLAAPGGMQQAIDPARAEFASHVITSLGRSRSIASRLSQIDVSDPQNAVVLLDGDAALLHLGTERFLERVQSYIELAGAFRDHAAEIDYVDLRFDRRAAGSVDRASAFHVYVRPGSGVRTTGGPAARKPAGRQF